ncbi:hypothetical protein [Leucobacter sp. cx-169]|uniref:hypothetical protein n=1 Tax=Leucobacter sp. cx-169 TaxID=2770549 RepID=UPI00165D9222|nr:hypothetical protein [Leucobacter sp. cx-169]MBC9927389.1 hypothetical protein [Leucobacter sp. cx-169]
MSEKIEKPLNQADEAAGSSVDKRSAMYGVLASGVVLVSAHVVEWITLQNFGLQMYFAGDLFKGGLLLGASLVITWIFCRSWKQWAVWAAVWAVLTCFAVGYATSIAAGDQAEQQAAAITMEEEELPAEVLEETADLDAKCDQSLIMIGELERVIADPSYQSWRLVGEDTWRGSYEDMLGREYQKFQESCQ